MKAKEILKLVKAGKFVEAEDEISLSRRELEEVKITLDKQRDALVDEVSGLDMLTVFIEKSRKTGIPLARTSSTLADELRAINPSIRIEPRISTKLVRNLADKFRSRR